MNAKQTVDTLTAAVKAAKERLDELDVVTSTEIAYMDAWMRTITDPLKAKYVTVSLVISADDIDSGEEYCLSVGAKISRKNVEEALIERDIREFDRLVDEAVEKISAAEKAADAVTELANAASNEFDDLVTKIKASEKKQRLYSIVGVVAILAVFAIFVVVSMNV